jgi:uncharacterized protein YcnI
MVRHTLRRVGAIVGVTAVALLATGLPAAAHVTVNPNEANQGGFAKLAFRVPNEQAKPTTKLEVAFPEKDAIANVSYRAVAGWKIVVTKKKLAKPIKVHGEDVSEAVDRVTWTADSAAAGIQPGQFQEFEVSAGPMPETDKLAFKALQTYDGGEVVRWIDEAAGTEEPEHPAPVLTLVKAATDDHHGAATETVAEGDAEASADHAADDGPSSIAIGGLIAGLAGLALGAVALFRTRKTT